MRRCAGSGGADETGMAQGGRNPRRMGPARYGAEQLGWVVQNRQRRVTHAPIGVEARRAESVGAGRGDARAREVFDAINSVVDGPFRACCRFDEYRSGVVRLLVNPPEMLYHVRSVWQARLVRELAQTNRRVTIRKVVFAALHDDDADRPETAGVRFFA